MEEHKDTIDTQQKDCTATQRKVVHRFHRDDRSTTIRWRVLTNHADAIETTSLHCLGQIHVCLVNMKIMSSRAHRDTTGDLGDEYF